MFLSGDFENYCSIKGNNGLNGSRFPELLHSAAAFPARLNHLSSAEPVCPAETKYVVWVSDGNE